MGKVWNDDEAVRLKAAHEGSAPFAAASWGEIERGLRRYVAEWDGAAAEVCDGGVVDDEASFACLEQSIARLAAFTARVGDADSSVVAKLVSAIGVLAGPERCLDAGVLAGRPTPVAGAGVGVEVSRVRELLAAAELSMSLGELARADGLSDQAHEAALASGFQPVVAEARLVQGRAAIGRDDSIRAEKLFHEALHIAQASGHDEAVLRSLTGYLRARAWADGDVADLQSWTRLADATLKRLGERTELAVDLDEARLEVRRLAGDLDGARELARMLATRRGNSAERRRWAKRQEGHILADLGETADAERIYDELLGQAERRLGAAHPELASLHLALGVLHAQDPKAAAIHFARAVDIVRGAFGTEDVTYARNALGLAQAKAALGELAEAKTLASQSAAIQRKLLPEGHPERSGALILLAELAVAEGELENGISLWKQVAKVTDPTRQASNYHAALNNIGYWSRNIGRLDESEPYYSEVLSLSEEGSALHDYARVGIAAHRARHGLEEEALALLSGLPRPTMGDELNLFELELWGVRAVLEGASSPEWSAWRTHCEQQAGWILAEVDETRKAMK